MEASPAFLSASASDSPIRGELFSLERLEQFGESLAASHSVLPGKRRGKRLLPRLRENGRVLLASYRVIGQSIREERAISPAAEWLVDNFHLVEEQLREIREDLPPGFYRELPKLAGGPLAGYPRVFAIAWSFIEHTDSRFDPEALRRFVHAYQRVQPLTVGELWALAISLRLVLVENLRRVVEGIVRRREARERADRLADRVLDAAGTSESGAREALKELESVRLSTAFAVQLVERLRDRDPAITPVASWLNERLAAMGTTPDEFVRQEQNEQVGSHVTVRNVISSMRLLSSTDWESFVEDVSLVEAALREGTSVAAMDFATRDRYRHAVEDLARGAPVSELEVARRAAAKARGAKGGGGQPGAVDERRADPGYYLISRGRPEFEKELKYRVPPRRWLRRAFVAAATPGYLGTIALLTLALLALPVALSLGTGTGSLAAILLAVLALLSASEFAIAVVNRDVTELIGPRRLPKLELAGGIPPEMATLVVVPALLTSEEEVQELAERLEVHALANMDGELRFALLTDWTDAPSETLPEDDGLLGAARRAVEELNGRHPDPAGGGNRFLLLHRKRVWNAAEGVWMGWERKRGKLHELNRWLRGEPQTNFLSPGPPPAGVRFVITLDADTRLNRTIARQLIGTMAHPLNRPVFDPGVGRVTDGHAILQPRVTPTLQAHGPGTVYQRVFSGPRGIDPYAFAVSDVYQDLFGEGIYTGKGVYEVDTFEAALQGRAPENALLSHDLFEGLFTRAGLVSDIELFERFPGHYEVAAARQHRWARGDWQLLPWVLGFARDDSGRRRGGITVIGRWKLLDNLRRTLAAPAAFLTLVGSWALPTASPEIWASFLLFTMAGPGALNVLASLFPRRIGIAKRSFLRGLGGDVALSVSQLALQVTLLAHQACLMTDAILRTLARLAMRRRLLEWVTAAQAQSGLDLDLRGFYRRMWPGPAAALGALAVALARPSVLPIALPFVLLWLASPAVARAISLPARGGPAEDLSGGERRTLRHAARRTWRFFEVFVTPADNSLPPDNYQEDPKPVLAHRTSPTNVGLYLLSAAAAHDMGWIGTADLLDRLDATFVTLDRLERYRGHFYNWYDSGRAAPLEPKYVSTVDSGNLAGHLLTLRQACLEQLAEPVVGEQALSGIADGVEIACDALHLVAEEGRPRAQVREVERELGEIASLLRTVPESAEAWATRLRDLSERAGILVDAAHAFAGEKGSAGGEVLVWCLAVRDGIASHARDISDATAWTEAAVPGGPGSAGLTEWALARLEPLRAALPSMDEAPEAYSDAADALERLAPHREGQAAAADSTDCIGQLRRSAARAAELARRLRSIARRAAELADAMDFRFLYDADRKLFAIGYRLSDGRLDPGYYDLLASEARLASFIAIAAGQVPVAHWFHLGRALTPVSKGSALVSWSGSMFEYLMPQLILRAPSGSLLEQSARLIVQRQIRYGQQRSVPWGVSESAYSARDIELTYQYSNFGVSGLGLKRGLSEDLVVAPYATALAAMVAPSEAARNFERLARAGAAGPYGFYEALDYTPGRLREGETVSVVRAHMAHHQGMTIVALANVLREGLMRERFHAVPMVKATELLLQERTPRGVAVARPRAEEVRTHLHVRDFVPPVLRSFQSPHDPTPRAHLLSNGRYTVMITAAGSGYSRWRDLDVTRWREDVTRDAWGSYVFLRDVASGDVWSAGYQPSGVEADTYEVAYSEDRAEIRRRDGAIATALEVVVSSEDDAEIRQVSVTNLGTRVREIEVTSYTEVALAPAAADSAHPAFSNLFVQTEYVAALDALLATRRPRAEEDERVWAAHVASVEGDAVGALQYETDRARFLGRGRGARHAAAIHDGRPLSNTVGSVLDPIFSLHRRVRLNPGDTARVTFTTLIAPTREAVLAAADKYRDPAAFERNATLAWTQAQVQMRHLGISADEAHLFQRLATRILYSDPTLRASPEVLQRNTRGPSALWAHGISGDVPIVLLRIDHGEEREIVRQVLRAHHYWRLKGLAVDLVIINEGAYSYANDLQGTLESLVRASQSAPGPDRPQEKGGVFLLKAESLDPETRDLLRAAARAILLSRHGPLAEQVVRLMRAQPSATVPPRPVAPVQPSREVPPPRPPLEFFNGLGGFDAQGRDYVSILGEGQWTPAPWINVVANPSFGFQVSESGSGFTWSENSRQNQLTPWSNDPVSDPPGEALFVRDEETGEIWGPTPLPIREEWPYVIRHGQGFSAFEHESHGIHLELTQFVPVDAAAKISRLRLQNRSGRPRRLTVTAYAEWVLGVSRSASGQFVVTERDAATGALFARNPWNEEFSERVAFADLLGHQTAFTADRTEFLGRNGGLDRPAALARGRELSGKVGAGMDPCAALQQPVLLPSGGTADVVWLLGQAEGSAAARILVERLRGEDPDRSLATVRRLWDDLLGTVQVRTPDRSMDLMLNRWLLYQSLVCRVWARSAFYQAGGAYGFRDQLQDVMALAVPRREVARAHILRAAARQFREGDVQHWWHPPSGKGVRTRISDDLLWLPYAVHHYVEVTGDTALLDERIPFLDGPPLAEDESEKYFEPTVSSEQATLFEHCARALDARLDVGRHGLPLMGAGDWNDGMNRVGRGGQGESVWLAWFLYGILRDFAALAEVRGERDRARRWRGHVDRLKIALEAEAWDGDWYRRAYFDDGTPLGSAQNAECRIDSIAQSWGVISGAADPARRGRAMGAVEEYLVRRGDGLVLLFAPPFDRSPLDPGYIKGYLPGVRENGGQYTHAALWSVIAFAALGDGDKAGELFGILNPVNHASTRAGVYRYKVEPYVAAADIYAEFPHVGRGGWTWYTGSSGWMYRAGVEWILGFRLRGTRLHVDPCIPRAWPGYELTFLYHSARYVIRVENPHGVTRGISRILLDGSPAPLEAGGIPLADDGRQHSVEVTLGAPPPAPA